MIKYLILAILLGIASIAVSSPNHVSLAGNQCNPSLQVSGSCINLVTGWGWPKAFVIDNAAVSTLGNLGTDDLFNFIDLVIDIIFYYGLISLVANLIKRNKNT